MLKLFVRFYLLMLLVILLVSLYWSRVFVYSSFMMDRIVNGLAVGTSGAVFQYTEDALASHPQSSWPHVLQTLTPQTPHYPLRIALLSSASLSPSQFHRLEQGQLVGELSLFHAPMSQQGVGYYSAAYQRIGNSNEMLVQVLQPSQHVNYQTQQSWLLHFITLTIQAHPKQNKESVLKEFSQTYGIPVRLEPLSSEPLDLQRYLRQFQDAYDLSSNLSVVLSFYHLYSPTQILVIGPYPYPWFLMHFNLWALCAVLGFLSLLMFLSVYPFSRDLVKLSRMAKAYGEGQFAFDVKVQRFGTLSVLYNNLKSMGSRIQTLLRSHKDLTQAVSHELKTPLSSLRFALSLIRDSKSRKAIAPYLECAEAELDELESLVTELLLYAQFDSHSFKLESTQIDLSTALPKILKEIKGRPPARKISLHFQDETNNGGPILLQMTPAYFQKLMDNLLSNAYRYAQHRIEVHLSRHGSQITIEVADDGPGIQEADRQKIFEPFVSLDASRNKSLSGHGLGLSLVKRIVELHHGSIRVTESATLKGAAFTLRFPAATP